MLFRQSIHEVIILLPVLLLALSVHEFSHAFVANLKGDPTAKNRGRLTLNPIYHLDPVGTLVLILSGLIGWAKPVPVNPGYFKDPRRDMMFVSIAGPVSNFSLAVLLAAIRMILLNIGFLHPYSGRLGLTGVADVIGLMIFIGVQINIALGIFNLIPVPPLDGSKILRGFLSRKYDYIFDRLEGPLGMMLLMFLVFFGLTSIIIVPFMRLFMGILGF